MVSPRFQGLRETLHVVVDGDTFPSAYRSGDTAVFKPTTLRSGTYGISLLPDIPVALDAADTVAIRGFAACYQGPAMSGWALPWPEPYRLSTYVADGAESAIIVDAATGTSRPAVPPEQHFPGFGAGPGWAYQPNSVVLSGTDPGDGDYYTCLWRLEPTPERGECVGSISTYTVALLGPQEWLIAGHHLTERTGSTDSVVNLESPYGLAVSPTGAYAVVSGRNPDGQLLVPAAPQDPIVRIPSITGSESPAAFTPDGDTAYIAGQAALIDTTMTLVVLDVHHPATPIREVDLGSTWVEDLEVDPAAAYLYVLRDAVDVNVTVLDRSTLRVVGSLRRPNADCGRGTAWRRMRLARNWGALYVIESHSFRQPASPTSWITRYDLVSAVGAPSGSATRADAQPAARTRRP